MNSLASKRATLQRHAWKMMESSLLKGCPDDISWDLAKWWFPKIQLEMMLRSRC